MGPFVFNKAFLDSGEAKFVWDVHKSIKVEQLWLKKKENLNFKLNYFQNTLSFSFFIFCSAADFQKKRNFFCPKDEINYLAK